MLEFLLFPQRFAVVYDIINMKKHFIFCNRIHVEKTDNSLTEN